VRELEVRDQAVLRQDSAVLRLRHPIEGESVREGLPHEIEVRAVMF
jgi:hypothetical protein